MVLALVLTLLTIYSDETRPVKAATKCHHMCCRARAPATDGIMDAFSTLLLLDHFGM